MSNMISTTELKEKAMIAADLNSTPQFGKIYGDNDYYFEWNGDEHQKIGSPDRGGKAYESGRKYKQGDIIAVPDLGAAYYLQDSVAEPFIHAVAAIHPPYAGKKPSPTHGLNLPLLCDGVLGENYIIDVSLSGSSQFRLSAATRDFTKGEIITQADFNAIFGSNPGGQPYFVSTGRIDNNYSISKSMDVPAKWITTIVEPLLTPDKIISMVDKITSMVVTSKAVLNEKRIAEMVSMTQVDYDAIGTGKYDADKLYIIVG